MDKYIWSHHPVLGEFSFHERFLVVKGMDSQKPHHSQVDQASGASEAGTTVRTSILNLRVEKMHIDSWLLSQKKNYWTSSVVPKWGMLSSNLINAVYFASKMLKETVTWPPFHGFFPIHREVVPFCQPFLEAIPKTSAKLPVFRFQSGHSNPQFARLRRFFGRLQRASLPDRSENCRRVSPEFSPTLCDC